MFVFVVPVEMAGDLDLRRVGEGGKGKGEEEGVGEKRGSMHSVHCTQRERYMALFLEE